MMGVAREDQRRGMGRAMMSRIIGDLKCSGIKLLSVQTLGSSDPSWDTPRLGHSTKLGDFYRFWSSAKKAGLGRL